MLLYWIVPSPPITALSVSGTNTVNAIKRFVRNLIIVVIAGNCMILFASVAHIIKQARRKTQVDYFFN